MLVQGMIYEAMWMWFHKFWGAKDPQFIICEKMIEIERNTKKTWHEFQPTTNL